MAVAAQNVAQAALEKATLAQRTLANELKALNSLQLSDTKTTKQAVTATPVTPVASESKVTSLGATSSTNQTNANDAVVGTKESEQREAATPVVTNLAVKTGAAKVKSFESAGYQLNSYQDNEAAQKVILGAYDAPIHLTDQQIQDLSVFVEGLINQVRSQAGNKPVVVTQGSLDYVKAMVAG